MSQKKPGSFRIGKTKRDRANHAQERNRSNKSARAAWNNEQTKVRHNGAHGAGAFPYGTVNGKRNRALKAASSS